MAVLEEANKKPIEIKNIIDGELVSSRGGLKEVVNPATQLYHLRGSTEPEVRALDQTVGS